MQPGMIFQSWKQKQAGALLSLTECFPSRLKRPDAKFILGLPARLLSKLATSALGLLKWLSFPLWGPVALASYLCKVLLAFLLGQRSEEARQRRIDADTRRREFAEEARNRPPSLTTWFGLAFLVYLLRKAVAFGWHLLLSPLLIVRFLAQRAIDAKAYVDNQRAEVRRQRERCKQLARQRKLDAERQAEVEQRAQTESRARLEEAERILEALRNF